MKIWVIVLIVGFIIVFMIVVYGLLVVLFKGYCRGGKYKFCDWVFWLLWGDCFNGCGIGIKI